VVTRQQTLRDGEVRGGIPFRRGALYHLLKNRIYRGDIVHHDKVYPGEHDGIVPDELFDAVQARLAANTADYRAKTRASSVSLLAGLIRDQSDRPLSPSHAVKAGKRYRYYVTNTAVPTDAPARVLRFPAIPLEAAIRRAIEDAIQNIRIDNNDLPGIGASELATIERAKTMLIDFVKTSRTSAVRHVLLAIDLQVEASSDQIIATCCRRKVLERLTHTIDWKHASGRMSLTVSTEAHYNGQELRLRINPSHNEVANPNDQLVALIVRALAARDLLIAEGQSIPTNRKRELLRKARAAYLAPDIITAIFEGRQPRSLTARAIDRVGRMPICWREQRRMFGFN
jgi:site-specific DNA recombinase